MYYDWDPEKAAGNFVKHGVTFNEAATVFGDTLGWTYPDSRHSESERRWITIGMSDQHRVLVVVHAGEDEEIRIISAREATRKERGFYEEG